MYVCVCPNLLCGMYQDKLFPPHCKADPFWIILRYLDHYKNVSLLSSFHEMRDGPTPACKGALKKDRTDLLGEIPSFHQQPSDRF